MATVKLNDCNRRYYQMPDLCMRCGHEPVVDKSKTFSRHPSWVWILLLAGLLPFAIVAVILTKRMRLEVPLCQRHRFHWGLRQASVLLSLLGVFGLAVVLAVLTNSEAGRPPLLPSAVWMVLPVCAIGWLIFALVVSLTTIRAVEITDYSITLTGVDQRFADAVDEYETFLEAGERDRADRWNEHRRRRSPRDSDLYEAEDDYNRQRRTRDDDRD
jgi:hypothetical protein